MDREQAIEEIVQRARVVRPRSSRALWIVALVLGLAGAIGFVVMLLATPGPATELPGRAVPVDAHGLGFATGLAIGLGVGLAIGFAIGRRPRSPEG